MDRVGPSTQKRKQSATDVEKYRQLVALQKQMVELRQQYERTKRECDTLIEQMRKKPGKVAPMKRFALVQSIKKSSKSRTRKTEKLRLKLSIGDLMAGATQKAVRMMGLG